MSLVHWWPLNGTYEDKGVWHETLDPSGTKFEGLAKLGQAVTISGDTQHMRCNDLAKLASMNSYTMSCWVYLKSHASGHSASFLSSGNWNTTGKQVCFGLYDFDSSTLTYRRLLTPGNSWSNNILIQPNNYRIGYEKWHHIVITYDGSLTRAYIDDVYIGSCSGGKINTTEVPYYYLGAATYTTSFTFKGNMNDFRIYNEVLSRQQISDLYNLKVLHFNFNEPVEAYTDLFLHATNNWNIYNNYNQPATLVEIDEKFHQSPVYRLTFTVRDASCLSNFQYSLSSHGIDSNSYTFKANTKYVHFVYFRPVTHNNIMVGGTASNISGWHGILPTEVENGWQVVGQYRDGTVTADKRDRIFTSFCCPTLKVGDTIQIDFACATLVEGRTQIIHNIQPSENRSIVRISDCSGFDNDGSINKSTSPEWTKDTCIGRGAYKFNGQSLVSHVSPFQGQLVKSQEWTITAWLKIDNTAGQACVLNDFNYKNYLDSGNAAGTPLLYLNAGANDYYIYGKQMIKRNEWIHIAYVFRNSDGYRKIYENGVDISGSGPNKTFTPLKINDVIQVGQHLKGILADYAIYATALSKQQIMRLYEVGAKAYQTGLVQTDNFYESTNLFNTSIIEQRIKDIGGNNLSHKIIYDNRNCFTFNPSTFYDGTYHSILNKGQFKPNTSYIFQMTINENAIYQGNPVSSGFYIYFTDGSADRTFIVATGGKWKTLQTITPKNKTIEKITIYYYTGTNFYIDLAESFIIENKPTRLYKNRTLQCGHLKEKGNSISLNKYSVIQGREFKEE